MKKRMNGAFFSLCAFTMGMAVLLACESLPEENTSGITISVQPRGGRYGAGAEVSPITVEAASDLGEQLSYQWYTNSVKSARGGTPLSGETGVSLTPDVTEPGTVYFYANISCSTGSLYSDFAAVTRYAFPIEEILLFWDDEPVYLAADWFFEFEAMVYSAEDEGSPGNYRAVVTAKRNTNADYNVWGAQYAFPAPKNFASLTNPMDDDPNDRDRATEGILHMNIYVDNLSSVMDSALELYSTNPSDGVSDHRIPMLNLLESGRWVEINKKLSDPDVTNGYSPDGGSNKDGQGDWSATQLMRFWMADFGPGANTVKVSDFFIYR
jgi:hypothetical protein